MRRERAGDEAGDGLRAHAPCGVEIEEGSYAAARNCAAAESAMARITDFDREERSILAAHQARIELAAGNAEKALAGFDRALEQDPSASKPICARSSTAGGRTPTPRLGRHQAAYADMQEYLSRMQAINEIETARQIAVLRVPGSRPTARCGKTSCWCATTRSSRNACRAPRSSRGSGPRSR